MAKKNVMFCLLVLVLLVVFPQFIYAKEGSDLFQYDNASRLVKRIHTYETGVQLEITYTYDKNGNLLNSKGVKKFPPSVPSPSNFKLKSHGNNFVTVSWDPLPQDTNVVRYKIKLISNDINVTENIGPAQKEWTFFSNLSLFPKVYSISLVAYDAYDNPSSASVIEVGL